MPTQFLLCWQTVIRLLYSSAPCKTGSYNWIIEPQASNYWTAQEYTGREIIFWGPDNTFFFWIHCLYYRNNTSQSRNLTLSMHWERGSTHVGLNRQQLEISVTQHVWFCCFSSWRNADDADVTRNMMRWSFSCESDAKTIIRAVLLIYWKTVWGHSITSELKSDFNLLIWMNFHFVNCASKKVWTLQWASLIVCQNNTNPTLRD